MIFTKIISNWKKKSFYLLHITFSCYCCSIDLERQSENAGLWLDTSSPVLHSSVVRKKRKKFCLNGFKNLDKKTARIHLQTHSAKKFFSFLVRSTVYYGIHCLKVRGVGTEVEVCGSVLTWILFKKLYILHHWNLLIVSIFEDCDTVIYLDKFYKPAHFDETFFIVWKLLIHWA